MRALKKFIKSLIIYYVVFMMLLSTVCYGGYTQEEVGDAVAGYAKNLMDWGNEETLADGGPRLRYTQGLDNRGHHPSLSKGNSVDLPWYYDCSSFVSSTYDLVCGMNLFGSAGSEPNTKSSEWDISFDVVGNEGSVDLMPGDVLLNRDKHVEIYIGDEYGSGGAHSNGGVRTGKTTNQWQVYYSTQKGGSPSISSNLKGHEVLRIKESVAASITNLNTEFSSGTIRASSSKIPLSDFYFNGVPDGKYSVASTNIFEAIITTLADVADYLIGILTYGIRIVIVGCTALVDQLINNTADSLLGENIDAETGQDTGISSVEINSANNENRLTIESLVFNEYDLLNVNIFKDSN